MNNTFKKYHGAGNDFILFDQYHEAEAEFETIAIQLLCHRRLGVGADGIIILRKRDGYDFEMIYYNADGSISDFCGNGGRCAVAFARQLGIIKEEAHFLAGDGEHRAFVHADDPEHVELSMADVDELKPVLDGTYLYTGTDHYVERVNDFKDVDVVAKGRSIRYHTAFEPKGTNANFIKGDHEYLEVVTYERGVENTTFACGTGIVASAIIAVVETELRGEINVPVKVQGGRLNVKMNYDGERFTNIWLCGPAEFVFSGELGA